MSEDKDRPTDKPQPQQQPSSDPSSNPPDAAPDALVGPAASTEPSVITEVDNRPATTTVPSEIRKAAPDKDPES